MFLGYNTNGFAFHDPFQAIDLLTQIGYEGIAITIDHQWLNPYEQDFERNLKGFRRRIRQAKVRTVIETGARYLLNPAKKHEPTLLSSNPSERARRVDFLKRCIDIADYLGAECVSLWSGNAPPDSDLQETMDLLAAGLKPVLDHAEQKNVLLGFEPEPGMAIDTMAAFDRLLQWIDSSHLRLTLDIGHLYCQGEVPLVDFIDRYADRIVNIHIEDMRAGVHEHLMFGDGEINFPPVLSALHDTNYCGGVFVELSRHSHDAPRIAKRSYDFLLPLVQQTENKDSKEFS